MLTQIHISNLVTIDKAHLDLNSGVTVITGETGAGKSILIEAIELALGGRSSPQLIRVNQDKLEVSVCFDLSNMKNLPAILKENDFDPKQECIIKRTITRDGKSRTFLNDMPVTLPVLRELSESLIDIHGQHEHQSLLKTEHHRVMLDDYGRHNDLAKQVRQLAEEYRALGKLINEHHTVFQQRLEKRDFLRFQFNELESLQLQEREWQTLELEHKQLANVDAIQQNLNTIVADFSQNENGNLLSTLHRSVKNLEELKEVSPQIAQWATTINAAMVQVDDVAREVQHYLDNLDINPERLFVVEQRMQTIHDLSRKYKVKPEELLILTKKIADELKGLESSEGTLAELEQKQQEALNKYLVLAKQLSEARMKSAKKLSKEITNIIQTLSLPHAEFQIELQKDEAAGVSLFGLEKIIFLVKTNKGSAFHPLAKIASGGELSRISLAIQLATAGQYTVPTMIFDEVDVGIGGSTAELVGKLLRRLGKTHQLFCITHLPQVAAYGHQHLVVQKSDQQDQTVTTLKMLEPADKIKEIARMLGGINITSTTLKHAQEMLEGAAA
jgi:DNA repair protein RecN (Recombination protein N)